jgi:hypothetical protein
MVAHSRTDPLKLTDSKIKPPECSANLNLHLHILCVLTIDEMLEGLPAVGVHSSLTLWQTHEYFVLLHWSSETSIPLSQVLKLTSFLYGKCSSLSFFPRYVASPHSHFQELYELPFIPTYLSIQFIFHKYPQFVIILCICLSFYLSSLS